MPGSRTSGNAHHRAWVVVGALAAGSVATSITTVVSSLGAGWAVVWEAVKGVLHVLDGVVALLDHDTMRGGGGGQECGNGSELHSEEWIKEG